MSCNNGSAMVGSSHIAGMLTTLFSDAFCTLGNPKELVLTPQLDDAIRP